MAKRLNLSESLRSFVECLAAGRDSRASWTRVTTKKRTTISTRPVSGSKRSLTLQCPELSYYPSESQAVMGIVGAKKTGNRVKRLKRAKKVPRMQTMQTFASQLTTGAVSCFRLPKKQCATYSYIDATSVSSSEICCCCYLRRTCRLPGRREKTAKKTTQP